jgi:hypothetical protein
MKCSSLLSAILLLPSACLFGPGSSDPAPGPLEWPQGVFVLMGTVQYSRATGVTRGTATESYEATLTIGLDDFMTLETNAGMCAKEDRQDVERQLARGFRSFSCGGATFAIRPAGSTVQGSLSVPYTHVTRVRGGCIAYSDDGRTCLDYSYTESESSRTARTTLRVRKSG